MLTNYAETPNGAFAIVGGGWDTVNVTEALELPEEVDEPPPVAMTSGVLAVRLMLTPQETDVDVPFEVVLEDADGDEVARMEGGMNVPRNPELPASWAQGINMVFPIGGIPLPNFGLYRLRMEANGTLLGEARFQVIKRYE
jgi:hypothetical protein